MPLDTSRVQIVPPRAVPGDIIIIPEGITFHIDEEASFTIDQNGPHAVQTAYVKGLRGSPAARLYYAAMAPGMPRYGNFHPVISDLPVSRVHVNLIQGTTDQATVTINYGFPTGGDQYFVNDPDDETLPQLEVSSTVQPVTTQFEIDPVTGVPKQIIVAYLLPPPAGEPGPTGPIKQAGSVEYMLPMETVRYTRRERDNPQDKAGDYVGRINSRGVFGDEAHMWLCSRLGGPSDDRGASFNVTYEFQKNPDSWDPFVTPTDPVTGQLRVLTADDLALVDGARHVQIYRTADFWELNLTLPEPE